MYVTSAQWSYWELDAALIPADYVHAVERALLVPPSEDGIGGDAADAGRNGVFRRLRSRFRARPGTARRGTFGVHEECDRVEFALLKAALERDMPVLAIRRGSQVLNVARGRDPSCGISRTWSATSHAGVAKAQ
jgi:putative glutamine amidotransferase